MGLLGALPPAEASFPPELVLVNIFDFYLTESIFIILNLLLLDSISSLFDSKSAFIRRSPFLTTKALKNPKLKSENNLKLF